MPENVSDRNGRAFEYSVCEEVVEYLPEASLTARAADNQSRDKQKFQELPKLMSKSYLIASVKIARWVREQVNGFSGAMAIDRLTDNEAMQGDVTDIRISDDKGELNLSIKHNHLALKHQRPPTVLEQLGFSRSSPEVTEYRKKYKAILDEFLKKATALVLNARKFSDLKNVDSEFINRNLYLPVCSLVYEMYITYGNREECANHLFKFLVGNSGFFKIVYSKGKISIYDFNRVKSAKSFKARLDRLKPAYIYLCFSNDWQISLRLHTASSEITNNVSLKFDTQPIEIPVEKWEL